MLTDKQKESIIAEVLQNATVKTYTQAELKRIIKYIEPVLDSALVWINDIMVMETSYFIEDEERKKLGIELLDMIIKKRMKCQKP